MTSSLISGSEETNKRIMDLKEIEEKYRITADYHTHTEYSRVLFYYHGKGSIMDNVRAAHEKGLREIAITDHGPSDFYGLNPKLIPRMREDIAAAMKEYPDVKVYLGVEADITDSPNGLDVTPEDFADYDFVNAGYHYVPNCNMIRNFLAFYGRASAAATEKLRYDNTGRVVRALKSNRIKILTHPGDKAYVDTDAVAAACEETGTLVEINARHRHPNAHELSVLAKYDVRFVISSDAHTPEQVGRYVESLKLAIDAGIDLGRIINIEER